MNRVVTVLIPHHNYQEYLPSAIQSVLDQTYECHICIIDDCSDDQKSVQKIVKDIIGENKHTLILLEDGPYGPSYARNRGIDACLDNTDVFVNLDADDIMRSDKVEKCLNLMSYNIGVVYADTDILDVTNNRTVREYREPYDIMRLTQECIIHSGAMINKDALIAVKESTGYYDESMRTCEDWDLWRRIAECFMIIHIPEALTVVRVQPKNSSVTIDKNIWQQNWTKVQQKAQARYAK